MVDKKTQGAPQNQPEKFIVPMSQDPAKAAAEAAAKAAFEQTLQAAAQGTTQTQDMTDKNHDAGNTKGTLRINSRASKRKIRRNTQDPFLWLKSPGTLTWGVASKWQFEDNAAARGQKLKNGEVKRIRCAHYDNDSKIYLWVTHHLDPDGYDVKLVNDKYEANIADWMFEEDLAPEPGKSQKFDLLQATELMLGLPALCIDTNKARKTKYFNPSPAPAQGEAGTKGTDKVEKKDAHKDDGNE